MNPYPSYKLSEMKWIERIPSHWNVERGKRLLKKMDRPVRDTDDVVTCFRDGVVTLRKNRRTEGFTESLQELGYQGIRVGDLVIHSMDAFAGAVGVSDSEGKGTPVYSVCKPEPQANAYYYAHAVREMARSQWIGALAKGIRERSTDFRYAALAAEPLPVPPLAEQIAIVCYLDNAESHIQRYISAKERLIELLTEQKLATINQAVTRGLDSNAPLKPSGVDWLGKVPAHWERRRLKTLLRSIDQRSSTGSETLLSLRRDYGVVAYDEHFSRPSQSRSLIGYKLVKRGQLVVNRLQVNNGLVFCSDIHGLVSPDYSVFDRRVPLRMQFLSDLLRTQEYRTHFRRQATGLGTGTAGFLRVYDDDFLNTHVYLPPLAEQDAILRYKDTVITHLDEKAACTGRQVDLMREYRTRLIADVVTGKLDARGAVAEQDRLTDVVTAGSQQLELDVGR